jgi:diacylglycerol O-acyltransferase
MEVMSPLDSIFLRLETPEVSLHIASVAIFDGPAPTRDEVIEMFRAKLPALLRYRQRVKEVPLQLGRPVWVDDPHFDLDRHIKQTALPSPGSERQLDELMRRLMSQPLRRDRPLWECWVVESLEGGAWAMINKVHHCMVDGIAGTDLLTTVLDETPQPGEALPDSWDPAGRSGRWRLLATAIPQTVRPPTISVASLSDLVRNPRTRGLNAVARARGLFDFAKLANPVPHTSLSGSLGPDRYWVRTRIPIDDVRTVRRAFGGTLNDVVLTAVTRGYRDVLIARGESPSPHAVRSLVPVSVRATDRRGRADNCISAVVADLPVHVHDARSCLAAVRAELDRLKLSGEVQAGEFITQLAEYVPPILLNTGLAAAFRVPQPFIATVTTNVPGPRKPLFAAGRELRELYPYVPIADQLRIGVAIMSYVDQLYVGVTADRDTSSDVDVLVYGIDEAITELVKLAETANTEGDEE